MIISINWHLLDEKDAKISIFDRWFLYGDWIFETIPIAGWKTFWLSEHLDRLLDWSSRMLMKLPRTKDEISKFCTSVVKASHANHYEKVKIILSRWTSWYGANIEELDKCKPNLVIYCIENKLTTVDQIKKGLNVMTTNQIRPYPKIKSTSYIASILGNIYAKKDWFDDILFIDDNQNSLEGSWFNVFIIRNWMFITPDEDVLDGITAQKTIEAIESMWYKVHREKINLSNLWEVSEIFITSTTKKILPVVSIDKQLINNGQPWTKTLEVIDCFTKMYY